MPAPQSIAFDGVCSDEQLKALSVIDVLELLCGLGLAHAGLVHRNTQESSYFVGYLEQWLDCSSLAGRSRNNHVDSRVPITDEVTCHLRDQRDGRLIASVLEPVKQFAKFCPRGVKLRMAVLILPEKFATADMTIEAAAVIPCTQHRSRAQLHQASSRCAAERSGSPAAEGRRVNPVVRRWGSTHCRH